MKYFSHHHWILKKITLLRVSRLTSLWFLSVNTCCLWKDGLCCVKKRMGRGDVLSLIVFQIYLRWDLFIACVMLLNKIMTEAGSAKKGFIKLTSANFDTTNMNNVLKWKIEVKRETNCYIVQKCPQQTDLCPPIYFLWKGIQAPYSGIKVILNRKTQSTLSFSISWTVLQVNWPPRPPCFTTHFGSSFICLKLPFSSILV